jgi:PilZ domain
MMEKRDSLMDTSANNREFSRICHSLEIAVTTEAKEVLRGKIEDISLNGLFFSCDAPLPLDSVCNISIRLNADLEELLIGATGKVVRIEKTGMGIEFIEIHGDESYQHLRELVLHNAPDTSSVEDEIATHIGIKKKDETF